MPDIPSHHLIYGHTTDFVTGEQVVDTDDERFRQQLARFLVEQKGYAKSELRVRQKIETLFARQFVTSVIDIVVQVEGKRLLVVRYGPGSIVTRQRAAIAAARVLADDQMIPLAVVTNGIDADVMDARSGKLLSQGLDSIPHRQQAEELFESLDFTPLADDKKRERELRILNAFDIEVCCAGGPCALPQAPEG